MNKLNIPIIMILGLFLKSAFAIEVPYDPKALEKYCNKLKDKEVKAEMVTQKDGKLNVQCSVDGKLTGRNDLWFYEETINKFEINANNKMDFSSPKWANFSKEKFIDYFAIKNKNNIDPKDCKFEEESGGFFIKCNDQKSGDLSETFKEFKKQLIDKYTRGEQEYALIPSEQTLKKLYAAYSNQIKKETTQKATSKYVTDDNSTSDDWVFSEQSNGIPIKMDDNFKTTFWTSNQFSGNTGNQESSYSKFINPNQEKYFTTVKHVDQNGKALCPIKPSVNITLNNPISTEKENEQTKEVDAESVAPTKMEEVVVNDDKDPNCNDKLTTEISKLLEDDTKNIIGLQYELTVIKMAAQVVGAQRVSLEGFAKKYEKDLAKADTGILDKMKDMYKKHGLKEDEEAVLKHLKEKTASANYYAKDKRFFNQDSSAFLMAYQQLNPQSGIKDTDVSILWFMDKVSEKSKSQNGQYSSLHNRTNLSTRIARYTGATDASQAISKTSLNEMANKQKNKIDTEFLALIANFRKSNPTCFTGEGETDCKLFDMVEAKFSDLLAINSNISSSDLVSLDDGLKGGINKTRFSISRYVESTKQKTVQEEVIVPVVDIQAKTQTSKSHSPDDDNDMRPED